MKQRYLHPELIVEYVDLTDVICNSLTEQEDYTGEEGGDL